MKTLIRLIPDREHARDASEALQVAGISSGSTGALARPAEVWELGSRTKPQIVSRIY